MREELVTFETAELAKKKGFSWTTNKVYDIQSNNNICNANTEYPENIYCKVGNIQAPTQSLLQKWLRDKHNIIVDVYQESNLKTYTGNWKVDISIRYKYQEKEFPEKPILNINYENALEIGLFEALNMIE